MAELNGIDITGTITKSTNTHVFRAVIRDGNVPVILKTTADTHPSPGEVARYRHEYHILKTLNLNVPKHVAQVLDLLMHDHRPYLVMEDMGGADLRTLLKPETPKLERLLDMTVKIASALGEIYQSHIIHKDIKPVNILFNTETGDLRLIDFSSASLITRETPTVETSMLMTATLPYMSPEQTGRMNRMVDWRTDFYSFGVTLYELFTGQLPFRSTEPIELVHAHLALAPEPPHKINAAIPSVLSDILLRLMAKNAEDRYQSPWGIKADLAECLKQVGDGKTVPAFPLARHDIPDRFQIPEKLYGREKEIGTLMAAFHRVSQGGKEMMLVAGRPGIGKTSLINEIYKPITQAKGYFISGKFDQFQRNVPYSAIVTAFQSLVRQLLSESEAKFSAWREELLSVLGPNGQVIIDAIPEVELIIGPQPAVPQLESVETRNRFKFVFQNFIHAFCRPEHPLAVFIDDLQWIDAASLNFLELMITDEKAAYLFLICAYRSTEVDTGHPLLSTLAGLKNEKVEIHEMMLEGLDIPVTAHLISDTLHTHKDTVEPLAKHVVKKTNGNPFFVNEFLKSLYAEDLIRFDPAPSAWQWDLEKIKARNITDNVVDLMTEKIQKLKPQAVEALKLSAAMGNRFELERLAIVLEKPLVDVVACLDEAVNEGLILTVGKADGAVIFSEYKFSHDRIQQAAYALIPEAERPAVHLKIGRLLRRNTPDEKIEAQCFDIVNQLNLGIPKITEATEKHQLAELNLVAGKKAKDSSAFEPALTYFNTGIELMPGESWQNDYSLTLSLFEEASESAYICTRYAEMERLTSVIIRESRTVLDTVKCYEVIIESFIVQNKLPESIEAGLSILEKLGIRFPKNVRKIHVVASLAMTKLALLGKNIESFLDRPQMENKHALAVIGIIRLLGPPMYLAHPNLFPLTNFKSVRLTAIHGNGPKAPGVLMGYSMILCGALYDMETGYKFGLLALKLSEKFNNKNEICFVTFCFDCFIRHWKRHVRESLKPMRTCYQLSLETGYNLWAGYSQMWYAIWSFVMGKNLADLEPVMAECMEACRIIKHQASYLNTGIFLQTSANLMGKTTDPCRLAGKYFDEEKSIHLHFEANERYGLHCVYLMKLMLCCLFYNYNDALANAEQAKEYEGNAISTVNFPLFSLYESLTNLAVFHDHSADKRGILKIVKSNQQKMKKWAHHAPMNYQHKFDLVDAERNGVLGKDAKAIEYYDKAIAGAKENQYIQEEALANELAAKFYLEKGEIDTARKYMTEARYCYDHWGAKAKVDHLNKNYPELLADISAKTSQASTHDKDRKTGHATTGTTTSKQLKGEQLDLTSVMKASQVISGEIQIEKLLSRMMQIIIENAGAEKGCLILKADGDFRIEAEGHIHQEKVQVLQSIPLEDSPNVPVTIIQYIARVQENLVLEDAAHEGKFTTDPYIMQHQPKSLLCAPLIHRNTLSGIIYLENNLAAGAFTPERLEVLPLLCSQAAISLENANLYKQQQDYAETLEETVEERTQELKQSLDTIQKTQKQLVQSEKMAAIGGLVAGVAHEINTPIGIAVSAASHLEDKTGEFVAKVESKKLKRSELNSYAKTASDSSNLILKNLSGAVKIVQGFKQVAVDQTSGERREFKLKAYIEDVLLSLKPKLKKTKHVIFVNSPEDLTLNNFPGALSQIISNLVMNSLIHGFEGIKEGEITFEAAEDNGSVILTYRDNGNGMDQKTLSKIFDPFFTTRRSKGGSGLGMHIVHNLVTQTLGGTIICESQPGNGMMVNMKVPMTEK